jgi:hypothetical protein
MDWIKIPTDSILYSEFKDSELIALIKYQALYCQLETEPTDAQLRRVLNQKQLKFVQSYSQVVQELCKSQVEKIKRKRNNEKENYKQKQLVTKNSVYGKSSERERNIEADKIREDKIRIKEISTNVLTKKVGKFIPPNLEEIETYIAEKNLSVSGRDFYDYFETGNWIDSKGQKVRNWKQKLLTWEKNRVGKRMQVEKPDLVQQNRANLWAFVQDSGVNI